MTKSLPISKRMVWNSYQKVVAKDGGAGLSDKPLIEFARKLNPKIRGWTNYYTKFNRRETYQVFYYLNGLIRRWIKNTYKIIGKDKLFKKYKVIKAANPEMFYHWKLGIQA